MQNYFFIFAMRYPVSTYVFYEALQKTFDNLFSKHVLMYVFVN